MRVVTEQPRFWVVWGHFTTHGTETRNFSAANREKENLVGLLVCRDAFKDVFICSSCDVEYWYQAKVYREYVQSRGTLPSHYPAHYVPTLGGKPPPSPTGT